MSEENLKNAIKKANELLFNNNEVKKKIDELKSITNIATLITSFSSLWWLIKRVVFVVEIIQKEYNLCTEEERIEVAATLLDELIQFKGWAMIFEAFDKIIFKLLISAAVQSINEKIGKQWLTWLLHKFNLEKIGKIFEGIDLI